jgi:hypothetical protein
MRDTFSTRISITEVSAIERASRALALMIEAAKDVGDGCGVQAQMALDDLNNLIPRLRADAHNIDIRDRLATRRPW